MQDRTLELELASNYKGINKYKNLLKSFDKWWIIYKVKKIGISM
jgi:hypothetical protein